MDLGLDAPGLGWPGIPFVPAQVGVDCPGLLRMASVVGAVEGEPAQRLGGPDVAAEPAGCGVAGGQQVTEPGGPLVGRPEPA